MPFCSACGAQLSNRNTCCTHHNQCCHTCHHNCDTSDNRRSTRDPPPTNNQRRPRRPLQIGFCDEYDAQEPYNSSHARPRYDDNRTYARYDNPSYTRYDNPGYTPPTDSVVRTSLPYRHVTAQLTHEVDIPTPRSFGAPVSSDYEQCPSCDEVFSNRYHLLNHVADFPVQCEVHGVCLRWEDVVMHAEEARHERCFVRGCRSEYRSQGRWQGRAVVWHVRQMH